jgi:endonuclease/exonuclease/phosphatase family metal-dependent hydrolase
MARPFRFFEKFAAPFSLGVSAFAFLASLAPHVPPGTQWFIALLGIGFPLLYLANAGFFVFWLLRRRLLLVTAFIPLVSGFGTAAGFVGFRSGDPPAPGQTALKVMSFNVRNFDLYNWTANWLGTAHVREDILALIRKENPDVVCFQEFYTSDTGQFRTVESLRRDAGYAYSHLHLPVYLYRQHRWGMAIFSKRPLLNRGVIRLSDDTTPRGYPSINLCLYADVAAGADTLRVYNLHFQSIRFRQEDYQFINRVGTGLEEKNLRGLGGILRRLRTAFAKREKQVNRVLGHVGGSPHPVVVCGDFNDTPSSFAYRAFSSRLADAFLQAGRGLGVTYTGPFPAFRIDYIFLSGELRAWRFEVPREKKLSDHYPVVCTVYRAGP